MECCSVCHETEELTSFITRSSRGKEVELKLCQKHLKLAKFDTKVVLKEELKQPEQIQMCCATRINSNGHCAICGDKY